MEDAPPQCDARYPGDTRATASPAALPVGNPKRGLCSTNQNQTTTPYPESHGADQIAAVQVVLFGRGLARVELDHANLRLRLGLQERVLRRLLSPRSISKYAVRPIIATANDINYAEEYL